MVGDWTEVGFVGCDAGGVLEVDELEVCPVVVVVVGGDFGVETLEVGADVAVVVVVDVGVVDAGVVDVLVLADGDVVDVSVL